MVSTDDTDVDLFKEFLKMKGYKSTLECFEKEHNYKTVEKKNAKTERPPQNENSKFSRFSKFVQESRIKSRKLSKIQEAYQLLDRKYKSILQCAREIFAVAIDCIKIVEEGKKSDNKIEEYKKRIGRYYKLVMYDTWDQRTENMSKEVLKEHKKKLNSAIKDKNNDIITEVLLSLRVYGLQLIPEIRKQFILQLVNIDILNIKEKDSFVFDLLDGSTKENKYKVRHAVLSVISIIASIIEGVNYLLSNGTDILKKIIKVMKGTEDGQVLQRFCLAILQKISVKESAVKVYLNQSIIDWVIKLLDRSRDKNNQIHIFCLDYASALLANILYSSFTINFLEENNSFCRNMMQTFLDMINEDIPISVLMHLLICLKCLKKKKFKEIQNECKFDEKFKKFQTTFESKKVFEEREEIEKNTVINLANHLFKGKEEENTIEYEERFKKSEEEQKDLVFECFQDEVI